VDLPDAADEGPDLVGGLMAGDRHAGHPAEPAGNHDQRHACHVADKHWPGQQVSHEAEPQQPGGHRHHAGEQRERTRQRGIPTGLASGQRADRDRRHQRRCRLRAHRHRSRRAERQVSEQRGQRRPEARDRRQAGHGRIGHDLRNQVGRHGQACHQVAAQPRWLVAAQQVDARDHAGDLPVNRGTGYPHRPITSGRPYGSGSITTEPHGHSGTQMPQPLQ